MNEDKTDLFNPMLRKHLYNILETPHHHKLGNVVNILLVILIIANVAAVILETDPAIYNDHAYEFAVFDAFSVGIFTLEYLLRLWVCREDSRYHGLIRGRIRFMLTPMAIVDLLAILPFYMGMILGVDTRVLRALRLIRIFKLTRHFGALSVMMSVIRQELPSMLSAILILMILIILASAGIFYVERYAQPEAFGTMPKAMWWAAVTLTTVGYGDVVPITAGGKVFGVMLTILGIGMAALPAGIIASGFTTELNRRRKEFRLAVRQALEDGVISEAEHQELREQEMALGMSRREVEMIVSEELAEVRCPHCGGNLREHD